MVGEDGPMYVRHLEKALYGYKTALQNEDGILLLSVLHSVKTFSSELDILLSQ